MCVCKFFVCCLWKPVLKLNFICRGRQLTARAVGPPKSARFTSIAHSSPASRRITALAARAHHRAHQAPNSPAAQIASEAPQEPAVKQTKRCPRARSAPPRPRRKTAPPH